MPAVVGLAVMGRAAEAEKPAGVGVGAQLEILHAAQAGALEPRGDVAGEIEQGVAGARRGDEKAGVRAIRGGEAADEVGADFVVAWRIIGPIAAVMCARFAPSASMASTVASMMPVKAPRQPACAAPITPAPASANRTGPQSAVVTPMARPRVVVTMASARGRVSAVHGASTVTACAE